MTRRRWIADEVSGDHAALIGDHARHLVRVLRARVGQEFDIVAGAIARLGRIASVTDDRVEFELGEELTAMSAANLTLLLAIFKFDRLEWAIEKCTELGVKRIVPVIARRTETHLASASEKRVERWRRLALQASEQSRRSIPCEILGPVKFDAALGTPAKLRVVLSETEQKTRLRDALTDAELTEIALAIGPEGGWTEDELRLFQTGGWISATLGPTILRAETAAIVATALAISEQGW